MSSRMSSEKLLPSVGRMHPTLLQPADESSHFKHMQWTKSYLSSILAGLLHTFTFIVVGSEFQAIM